MCRLGLNAESMRVVKLIGIHSVFRKVTRAHVSFLCRAKHTSNSKKPITKRDRGCSYYKNLKSLSTSAIRRESRAYLTYRLTTAKREALFAHLSNADLFA